MLGKRNSVPSIAKLARFLQRAARFLLRREKRGSGVKSRQCGERNCEAAKGFISWRPEGPS
jgi:hypothetical protein